MQEQTIFIEALEIEDEAERAAFLDRACGGGAALRERVGRLLLRHKEHDSLLDRTGGLTDVFPPPPAAPPVGPGAMIGPYKLLHQIGEGGMGTVFLAEQDQPVRRKAAIKIVKAGMASPQAVARFEAERQALAMMDHPNIARVFDGGTTADGRPYLVMELIKAVPITRFCDERRLTPRQRLELFAPVCAAVQHAHQKGIIHRDIKPSNVLVALYDDMPVPKVIDFGIAKATGEKLTQQTLFTELGAVVGTLEYMSPEQASLNQLDVDTRSDIYSLGVLLYELLTGSPPLDRKRMAGLGMLEVLRLIREEEPPKPSARLSPSAELPAISANRGVGAGRLCGLVKGELDWIVMKCLEKERARRYETAGELAQDIHRYLADEPVLAGPPSAVYRLRKFASRHSRSLITIAAVSLIALLGAAGIGWAMWRGAGEREARMEGVRVGLAKTEHFCERAREMPAATSGEAAAAIAVWRQAGASLAQAEAALDAGGSEDALHARVAAAREAMEEGLARAEASLAYALKKEKLFSNLDEARMSRSAWSGTGFNYLGLLAKYDKAFTEYGLAVKRGSRDELARRIRAEEPAVREALILALEDWADAAESAVDAWHLEAAALIPELWALVGAADRDPWRARYRAAWKKVVGARQQEAIALLADLWTLAWTADRGPLRARERVRRKKALDEEKRTLKELQALSAEAMRPSTPPAVFPRLASYLAVLGDRDGGIDLLRWARLRHPTDFWLHFYLGDLLRKDGQSPARIEERIGCYHAALALRPRAGAAHNNLGQALVDKGRLDDAIDAFRTVIECEPDNIFAHMNLGVLMERTGRAKDALASYRRAVELAPLYAPAHAYLGEGLAAAGKTDEAIACFNKAIGLNAEFAPAHRGLGIALWRKGEHGRAIACYRKAIQLDGKDPLAHAHLGDALRAKKQFDEAILCYREAIKADPNYSPAYCNLGAVLCDIKRDYDGAIDCFKKAITIDKKDANSHYNLGNALSHKGEWGQAMPSYRQAITLDRGLVADLGTRGISLRTKGRVEEAILCFSEIIRVYPDDARAHLNLGSCLFLGKQLDKAVACFQKAIKISPDYAMAHRNLGVVLHDKQDWDGAIASLSEAIKLGTKDAAVHFKLGNAFSQKGKLGEAIANFEAAIGINPKYPNGYYLMGEVTLRRGKFAEAKSWTEKALERLGPKHPLHPAAAAQLEGCKRLLSLEARLDKIEAGTDTPADNKERAELAFACRLKRRNALAARLYADAFAADPRLADNLMAASRYNAACCAALAAAGEPDDKEHARLRQQALDWLRADLAQWGKLAAAGGQGPARMAAALRYWQEDADLAGVRDAEALKRLPEGDHAA
jgi:tetratricopeptide (TPR) repeat protein